MELSVIGNSKKMTAQLKLYQSIIDLGTYLHKNRNWGFFFVWNLIEKILNIEEKKIKQNAKKSTYTCLNSLNLYGRIVEEKI